MINKIKSWSTCWVGSFKCNSRCCNTIIFCTHTKLVPPTGPNHQLYTNKFLCLVNLQYCKQTAKKNFVYSFNIEKCWSKNRETGQCLTCINFRHQRWYSLCSCELFFFWFIYPYACCSKIYCCQEGISVLAACISCSRLVPYLQGCLLCLSSLGQIFRLHFGFLSVWRDEDSIALCV